MSCIHHQYGAKITSEGVLVQCVHCGWTANSKYWGEKIAEALEIEMVEPFHDFKNRMGMAQSAAIARAVGEEYQHKSIPPIAP
jgi:hypothetical protein